MTTARRVLLLGTALALCVACLGPVEGLYPPRGDIPTRSVWIVNHGMHTGLVIAQRDLVPPAWPGRASVAPGFEHMEIGWGDRQYYQASRKTWTLALRAAVASAGSAIHVVGFNGPASAFFPGADTVEVTLSRDGFNRLARFIHDTFVMDPDGHPIPVGAGLYSDSVFFRARPGYHILDNCNTWTARALRAAGCPITPLYAITAGNVMYQVEGLSR